MITKDQSLNIHEKRNNNGNSLYSANCKITFHFSTHTRYVQCNKIYN